VECKVIEAFKRGDHTLFVGEVVEAHVKQQPAGRLDDATCWLKDLGEKVYYGG
jgi:flavin reductase (DIM6/NTAB) family NADH-FMN oxidoreductase RutF